MHACAGATHCETHCNTHCNTAQVMHTVRPAYMHGNRPVGEVGEVRLELRVRDARHISSPLTYLRSQPIREKTCLAAKFAGIRHPAAAFYLQVPKLWGWLNEYDESLMLVEIKMMAIFGDESWSLPLRMHIHASCLHVCCMYVCMYVICIYVCYMYCMYVCMYVCMYACTRKSLAEKKRRTE